MLYRVVLFIFLRLIVAVAPYCNPAPTIVPSKRCRWKSTGVVVQSDGTSCPKFEIKCTTFAEECYEIPKTGGCRRAGRLAIYAFDVYSERCKRVRAGQCLGVSNRFLRRKDCEKKCERRILTVKDTKKRRRRTTDSKDKLCAKVKCRECHKCEKGECVLDRRLPNCDPCATVRCDRCRRCVAVDSKQAKCVVRESCTDCGYEQLANCFVDPCLRWKQQCPAAHSCVSNYCGGCKAYFYDAQWNQLEKLHCRGVVDPCSLLDCKQGYTCSVVAGKATCFLNQNPDGSRLEKCSQFPTPGACKAAIPRYYYDRHAGECLPFTYGGCGGNSNNFETTADCRKACEGVPKCPQPRLTKPPRGCEYARKLDPVRFCPTYELKCDTDSGGDALKRCNLPEDKGPCEANIPKWRYNRQIGSCVRFYYGGCKGNRNNFASSVECFSVCGKVPRCPPIPIASRPGCQEVPKLNPITYCPEVEFVCSPNGAASKLARCSLPVEAGPCRGSNQRYYYDRTDGTCKLFVYGGCQGNTNNFLTHQECFRTCYGVPPCPRPKLISRPGCQPVTKRGYDGCPIYELDCSNPCLWNPCGRCKLCVPTSYASRYECRDDHSCPLNPPATCAATLCGPGTVCSVVNGRAICVPSVAPPVSTPFRCLLPAVRGPCREASLRFFFNTATKRCESFFYGGCRGNANRFRTEADCRHICLGVAPPVAAVCPRVLPGVVGICVELCSRDSDCNNGLKCCSNGCGHACVLPVIGGQSPYG